MYKRILLCYDGSTEGRNALREGADIARSMQTEVYLLAICRSSVDAVVPEGISETLFRCDDERATAVLNEGVQWLQAQGLTAQGALRFGDPIQHIAAFAKQIRADLIVVGHRPRSRLERWWRESDEQTLLDRVECSILAAVSHS